MSPLPSLNFSSSFLWMQHQIFFLVTIFPHEFLRFLLFTLPCFEFSIFFIVVMNFTVKWCQKLTATNIFVSREKKPLKMPTNSFTISMIISVVSCNAFSIYNSKSKQKDRGKTTNTQNTCMSSCVFVERKAMWFHGDNQHATNRLETFRRQPQMQ